MLYDSRHEEVFRYNFKNSEDTSKPVSGIMFYRQPEDCALVILKSEDLVEAYEAGELSGELKKIVSGMKVDDNPVLMLIQFKGQGNGLHREGGGVTVCGETSFCKALFLNRNLQACAERVGFKPTEQTSRSPDFESGPFDHSGIFP